MKINIGENLVVNKKQIIVEEYVKYFTKDYKWTLFFNGTFRKYTSYEIANRRFMWFFKYLNKENERYFTDYIRCLVFHEKSNALRGNVHIHALIDRIDPKHSNMIHNKARKYFGELSVVKPYDSSRGAAYYLANKIDTDKLVNYKFCVINSKIRGRP